MYLLVRRPIEPSDPTQEWELLLCLAEEVTQSGFTPLMRTGNPPLQLGAQLVAADEPVSLVEFIGAGTFGTVIRAADKMNIHRAMKVFLPAHAIRDDAAYIPHGLIDSTDYNEITLTNKQAFKHVVAVAAHGYTTASSPPPESPLDNTC